MMGHAYTGGKNQQGGMMLPDKVLAAYCVPITAVFPFNSGYLLKVV